MTRERVFFAGLLFGVCIGLLIAGIAIVGRFA